MSAPKTQDPLVFTHTADSILQETKEAIECSRADIKKALSEYKDRRYVV